jgi:protein-tyrosine phosphatase
VFLFSKPKKRLADLIPNGYIDIHSHLLPGIDDGSKDEAHTYKLVQALKEYGFAQFITTPHILPGVWNNTRDGILDKEASTKVYLEEQGITSPFKAAAEYLMDDVFLKRITEEPLLTIKDKYVLVEMSYLNAPLQLYDIIYELQLNSYKPVLAHPERYVFYHNKFEEYSRLKKAGCLFQINLLSVNGYYGKHVADIGKQLLEKDMIDFTGSDTHHERHVEAFKNPLLIKDSAPLVIALNKNSLFSF